MKRNSSDNIISVLIILAEILAGVACFLSLYLHLPAQRYMSVLSMGRKYLNEMKYDESVNMYRKAIRIEPKEENGYLGLGQAYTAKADSLAHAGNTKIADVTLAYDKAADAYQKVIDLDQNSTDGYYYQAEVYTKAGDAAKSTAPELAYNYYQSALKVYKKVQTSSDSNDAVAKAMSDLTEKTAASQIAAFSIVEYHQSSEEDLVDTDGTNGILRLHNAVITVTDSKHAALEKSLGELKSKLIEIAKKNHQHHPGYDETMRAEVTRNDGIVFSVKVTDLCSYTGMRPDADPYYRGEWGFNYDARTGNLLTLDDVLTDPSNLLDTATKEYALENADVDADALLDRISATRARLDEAPVWWLSDSGLVLNAEANADSNGDGYLDRADNIPELDWYFSGYGAWTDETDYNMYFISADRFDMSLPYDQYGPLFQPDYLPGDHMAMLNGVDYVSQEEKCLEDAISRSDETDQKYASCRAMVTKFDFTGDGTDDIIVVIKETHDYDSKQAAYCYACDGGRAAYADELDLQAADDACGFQNDLIVRYENPDLESDGPEKFWYNRRFTWNGNELVNADAGIRDHAEDFFIEDAVNISQLTDLYDASVHMGWRSF